MLKSRGRIHVGHYDETDKINLQYLDTSCIVRSFGLYPESILYDYNSHSINVVTIEVEIKVIAKVEVCGEISFQPQWLKMPRYIHNSTRPKLNSLIVIIYISCLHIFSDSKGHYNQTHQSNTQSKCHSSRNSSTKIKSLPTAHPQPQVHQPQTLQAQGISLKVSS